MAVDFFDEAVQLIQSGIGPKGIDQVIRHALKNTGCTRGALIGVTDQKQHVLASIGLPFSMSVERRLGPDLAEAITQPAVIHDFATDKLFCEHILNEADHAEYSLLSVPLANLSTIWKLSLALFGSKTHMQDAALSLQEMQLFAENIANKLELICDIARQKHERIRPAPDIESVKISVQKSPCPIILLDESLTVLSISDHFARRLGSTDAQQSLSKFLALPERLREQSQSLGLRDSESNRFNGAYNRVATDPSLFDFDAIRHRSDKGDLISLFLSERGEQSRDLNKPHPLETSEVLTRFLADTLVKRVQIKRRGNIGYHTLYRWRKTVKEVQISALKSAKTNPSQDLVDLAKRHLVEGAVGLFGTGSFDKVTHVACGHSGPDCFACQIASSLAAELGKEFEPLFETLPVTGSSHPKSNVKRPRAKLITEPKGRYLIIDDVATSGHHIAEATKLIRSASASASPLAWISN